MQQKRPLRRHHLLAPSGVGAMVDFPNNESLMTAGLDAWPLADKPCPDEWKIVDERLQARLGVAGLRWPPEFRERGRGLQLANQCVPFVRFPRWHYCPRCGAMEKLGLFSEKQRCTGRAFSKGVSCFGDHPNRRRWLIPFRFVAICERGHIEDFPLVEWIHSGGTCDGTLRFDTARSASSVFGMKISCSCGKERTLAGITTGQDVLQNIKNCGGHRPWLGEDESNSSGCGCGCALQVAEKGATNVHYAHVVSSLYLPKWESSLDRRIVELLDSKWDFLLSRREGDGFRRSSVEDLADINNVDFGKLLEAAERRLKAAKNIEPARDETAFRRQEYDALLEQSGGDNQDFRARRVSHIEYSNVVATHFENIVLLSKLRETRALVGFSRWMPDDEKTFDERLQQMSLHDLGWLPSVIVRGEGVFFHFDSARLDAWSKRNDVQKRAAILNERDARMRALRKMTPRVLQPRFVLLHTFAHLMIGAFSQSCGYSSASLRERIYCDDQTSQNGMSGVLVYTASGDCEGSMGGLVRQGQPTRLEPIMQSALEGAMWCSSDPVCAQSQGQGPDSRNLAACHCCALLPETSCEEQNLLLDRALVVGLPHAPELGYFNF